MNNSKIEFINLTPHDVVIYLDDRKTIWRVIPSSGVARVNVKKQYVRDTFGVPTYSQVYGSIEGLPHNKCNTVYIVSLIVLNALDGTRSDVVAPDTGETCVRDYRGNIKGITQFIIK